MKINIRFQFLLQIDKTYKLKQKKNGFSVLIQLFEENRTQSHITIYCHLLKYTRAFINFNVIPFLYFIVIGVAHFDCGFVLIQEQMIICLNIFELSSGFFPLRIYIVIKLVVLALNFYWEDNPKRTMKNRLNMELLTAQAKKYEQTPYKYISSQMQNLEMWKNLPNNYIQSFFQEISNGYNDIPYHNLTHAFDVSVTLDKFLVEFQMGKYVCKNDEERIYMLIAAYAHDMGHQGFNNSYYIQNDHNLAIQFSYLSPLENLHSSSLMRLLRKYDKIVPKSFRKNLAKMILMTDIATQTLTELEHLKQIGEKLNILNQAQKILLAGHLLHAADINNTAKDLQTSLKWNNKLYIQFEKQEQIKKKVSNKLFAKIPKLKRSASGANEINFIDNFVLPLYKQLGQIQPKFHIMVEKIEENKNFWVKQAL